MEDLEVLGELGQCSWVWTYIDDDDGNSEGDDKDCNIEIWSPILYDNSRCSKIVW